MFESQQQPQPINTATSTIFSFPNTNNPTTGSPTALATPTTTTSSKKKPKNEHYVPPTGTTTDYKFSSNEVNYQKMDKLLENEKQKNKTESWTKLDKTIKLQKLTSFAEKYGKDNGLPVKEIKQLHAFFSDCLEKNKLQKIKDVVYDKETREITSIPALHFNTINQHFTLKIIDSKRVSTLKSLTPKRASIVKPKENTIIEEIPVPTIV
jgi:hypothetical protein